VNNQFNLGKALWESGKDKPRGMHLARAALADFKSLGAGAERHVTVTQNWLARHE
jgi:hypothetical protein